MTEDQIHIEFIYSDTCPDCPPAKRIVENVTDDMENIKVDYKRAKDSPGIIKKHEITHVPTIIIDGEVAFIETLTEKDLEEKLDNIVDG
ncbi:MAG: thioredoxin family protein [Thermoplasmatota archaeon]